MLRDYIGIHNRDELLIYGTQRYSFIIQDYFSTICSVTFDFFIHSCFRQIPIFMFQVRVTSMQRQGTGAIRTQIAPSEPNRKLIKLQIVKIQREHMGSAFPNHDHSAAQTELKIR